MKHACGWSCGTEAAAVLQGLRTRLSESTEGDAYLLQLFDRTVVM